MIHAIRKTSLHTAMLVSCMAVFHIAPAHAQNLLQDPGFESGSESWNFDSRQSTLSADAFTGDRSATVSGGNTGVTQVVDARPGDTFDLSVMAKTSNGADGAYVGFLFRDADGRNMPGTSVNERVRSEQFEQVTVSGTTPDNARYLVAFAWKETVDGELTVDDYLLERSGSDDTGNVDDTTDTGIQRNMMPVFISANFVIDTVEEKLQIVDEARAAGANAVLINDSKINRAPFNSQGASWENRMKAFVDGVKQRDMKVYVNTVTMGYCAGITSSNTNLTTGYPIINQPLQRSGNRLVTVSTAAIPNGGFEAFSGNSFAQWDFQDAPGALTFADTNTRRSGSAALRLDGVGGQSARAKTTLSVEPWHQYTLSFWVKLDQLTARRVSAIVRDTNNPDRQLTQQNLSVPANDGRRQYFTSTSNRDLDWTEMRLTFNSQDVEEVDLFFAVFGGQSGSAWIDDARLLDTPTLNWLRRDDLPQAIQSSDGFAFSEGADHAPIVDPNLGMAGYAGSYTSYHRPPTIEIPTDSAIAEGQTVLLNGYHAMVTQNGQVSCSWNHPDTYAAMQAIHEYVFSTYDPDGVMLNYDEIRTGGFEPLDQAFSSSGDALAASIERAFTDLEAVAPDSENLFWSDMIDPFHNARANYYQIANTLENAWLGIQPSQATLVTWWAGQNLVDRGADSLQFFDALGFDQIIGGFYDEDVDSNYQNWAAAAAGVGGIQGGMYASWVKPQDFSGLGRFGDLWWK